MLGYSGPTVLIIKTTCDSILGAFGSSPWKESTDFFGNPDCFLFELTPKVRVHRPIGTGENFYVPTFELSSFAAGTGKITFIRMGIGYGGTLEKPRLFIPESFENCSADFLDKTYQSGELLPENSLEKFEIKQLEVWGVGGDETIQQALRERAEYRERTDTAIARARTVKDKTAFAKDMKEGLVPNKLFEHDEQVRRTSGVPCR